MTKESPSETSGELLGEEHELTLAELCRASRVSAETVLDLVAEGVVDAAGGEVSSWRFRAVSIRRVRCAVRLQRDLGVNAAGAALALDLLEELESARQRLRRFGG